MSDQTNALYRYLGYRGPMPGATPVLEGVESVSEEIAPLDLEQLRALRRQLDQDPEGTLERARRAFDQELTEEQFRDSLESAEAALTAPDLALEAVQASDAHLEAAFALPPDFTFPGMDLTEININPGSHKFETTADALGWVLFSGPFVLGSAVASKPPFRLHWKHTSGFIYEQPEPAPGAPIDLALMGDFGTGLYHSSYIAKQFRGGRYSAVLHLGDVYYAGRKGETDDGLRDPLAKVAGQTPLFFLLGNHEMYSAARPWWAYIDELRAAGNPRQVQEGAYFCLRWQRFQLLGLDTSYDHHGRLTAAQADWLLTLAREGRDTGRATIVLTSDHPYEYEKKGTTDLLDRDLHQAVTEGLVDLWFWGNTHYCALFPRTDKTPFIGSCIGHAGYPYSRKHDGRDSEVKPSWLETTGRFPARFNLRTDRGNNGYCVLSLRDDGSAGLRYVDWMSNLRCTVELNRVAGQPALELGSISPEPEP